MTKGRIVQTNAGAQADVIAEQKSLRTVSIELVSTSAYDAETNDFTSMLTRIKANDQFSRM